MDLTTQDRKDVAIDQIEDLLDPLLRDTSDRTSSAHDLVLDAGGDELLSALYDARLLRPAAAERARLPELLGRLADEMDAYVLPEKGKKAAHFVAGHRHAANMLRARLGTLDSGDWIME